MKKAFYVLAALVLIILGATTWLTWVGLSFVNTPPETPGRSMTMTVPKGATFDQTARQLKKLGVITDADKFRILGRWRKQLGAIKAGEFMVSTGMTPPQVLDALTSGREVLHTLRVVEGLAWWQVADVVAESGLADQNSFAQALRDPKILEKYHIPFADAEGFLFPDTYHLPRPPDGDARPIVEAMLAAFFRHAAPKVWPEGTPDAKELKKTIILASMVEKETGDASERGTIAGVFANRLKKRMRMQCDPTVIYGLGRAFDGNLRRSHLRDKSNPYNTYTIKGLPPGPICSPGVKALHAAKNPEKHSFIYFVARGDGGHKFSATLAEHNRAVRKYQLKRR